jgi:glycosyltransferase involved in cell wall biosynthesis
MVERNEHLVSVIIPCFNSEKYISECINSVLEQTYSNIEIICVDNNSTDGTLISLFQFAKRYPKRIKVIEEATKGASAARNAGLKNASGEWIQFLDADDILLPEKIKHQLSLINQPADMIVGNYIIESDKQAKVFSETGLWKGLIKGKLGFTCSNLFRKIAVEEAGGWIDIKSSQEYNLMFRILKNTELVIFDKEFLTVKKERNIDSISNSNRPANWLRYIELRMMIWDYLRTHNKLNAELERTLKINIFDSIRVLYGYDNVLGIEAYNKYVKGRFEPIASSATSGSYLKVYRLMGFRASEIIKKILR